MKKQRLASLLGGAFIFICASNVWALNKVTVTAATGGSAISADTTGGTWTTLTGPVLTESSSADIHAGTIILTAPNGFLFNAGVTVTVQVSGSTTASQNVNGTANNGTFNATVAADGSTVTATINTESATANTLTFQNIQVRPTAGTPLASGNITESGTSVLDGLTLSTGTWGALTEVAGAAARMIVTLPNQTFTSGSGNSGSVVNQTAGTSFNITKLTAADQFNNIVTGYSGAKTISYSGPGGNPTYTTAVSFTSGQSTTTLATTLTKAETTAITATDGTLTGVASSGLTVNVGIFNKLQVLMPGETAAPGTTTGKTGTASGQTAGVAFSVTVNAVDANFNLISTNDTVHFTSTDANATLPANGALSLGTLSSNVTFKTSGSQTVTVSDVTHSGVTAGTSAPVTVSAASAALVRVETAANGSGTIVPTQSLSLGNSITVYSISRDAFSNFVANVAANSWSLTGITGGVSSGDLVAAGDSKSATFTANATGSAVIHAPSGSLTATDSGTITVTAGSTTTALSSSPDPSVFGQSVTFTATVSPVAPATGTPTGTVTFKDGATTLGTGTLSGGSASFSTNGLSVASHSITAVYGGDVNYNTSTSAALTQVVNKSASTVGLASSANPSVFGQSVTLTATVSATSPGNGTPTGTVTFKDGATSLATNNLTAGSATYTSSTLSVTSHSITAVYNGDSNFTTNTSSALSQVVNKSDTTATLTSSTNPTVFGQAVVFTATVAAASPGVGTPSGTVTFKDGATALSTNTLSGGQVNYTNSTLAPGSHSLTAVYNGDGNFNTNTSGVVTQTVGQASSTTSVASSANPSVFGQSVTFTATVSAVAPGAGTPTGSVIFQDGGTPLVTNNLSSGQATFASSSLSVGSHSITAIYAGDSNFSGSDNAGSPLSQTVNAASTTTTVASSANPSVSGQSVTFTATVSVTAPGSGTPTGTVTFKDGATTLGTGTLGAGSATYSTSTLSVTSHSITALYAGDGNFNTSTSSALTQTVNKANSTTAVTSSANPSVSGQSVVLTATVSASSPGSGTPSGTVVFKDGGVAISTNTLSGGVANYTNTTLSVASHSITVAYNGDASFNTNISGTLTQTVNKASSSVALGSSANPSVFGQSVTITATVSAVSPASGTPTGTVTFKDGATSLATNNLSGGVATYTSSTLSVTSHSITAVYNGDSNFNTNTSSALTQTVNKSDTTPTLTSNTNPSVFGQSVIFTATVAATSPGAGTPTGTVVFKDGATALFTNTLSGGSATYTNSALSVTSHSMTVVYNGDGNFNTNTSAVFTQTVNQANSTTTVSSSANPSVFGQSVTFTATVSAAAPGAGTPTGTVQFQTNGVNYGSPVSLSGGSASAPTLSSLAVGSTTVAALYSGDGNFNASDNTASPLTQTVNKANTSTALSSSANPSVSGQSVTFTATVTATAPGSGTPSGTVTFKDGATTLGTGTLSSGSATFTTNGLSVASHSITAVYAGDGSFNTNTSGIVTQTVNKASSATALASSANPSVFGQSVTFTATVSAVSPGSGTPTGTVTFKDGATSLATNNLSGG